MSHEEYTFPLKEVIGPDGKHYRVKLEPIDGGVEDGHL